jgi:hypothetical protein
MSLFDWAQASDYLVFDLFGHSLATADIYATSVDRYYWDYLLLPAERELDLEPKLRAGARAIFDNFAQFRASGYSVYFVAREEHPFQLNLN